MMRGLQRLVAGHRAHIGRRLEPYIDNAAARHTSRRLFMVSSSNNVSSRVTSSISRPFVLPAHASSGLGNFVG